MAVLHSMIDIALANQQQVTLHPLHARLCLKNRHMRSYVESLQHVRRDLNTLSKPYHVPHKNMQDIRLQTPNILGTSYHTVDYDSYLVYLADAYQYDDVQTVQTYSNCACFNPRLTLFRSNLPTETLSPVHNFVIHETTSLKQIGSAIVHFTGAKPYNNFWSALADSSNPLLTYANPVPIMRAQAQFMARSCSTALRMLKDFNIRDSDTLMSQLQDIGKPWLPPDRSMQI